MTTIIDVDFNSAKPLMDKKEYRLIKLPSGLEVFLVSTKNLCESRGKDSMDTAKSAASMLIQCGSFADPINVAEGAAHFIEHMVFMGSEKYPVENHYDSFIQSHGGNCNAFTEGEYTVYQFDVDNDYFPESLDIFANCFISPLLSMSSSDREIKAIESEFQLAVNSDSNRCQQLFLQDTIKDHPVRVFGWGNKKSLSDIPANLGVNMQSILKGFYDTHFTPNNMKLVTLSPKTLDEIQYDVEQSFLHWNVSQAIPVQININSKSSNEKTNEKNINLLTMDQVVKPFLGVKPFNNEKLSILSRVIPIKNTHNISIYWAIPGQVPSYKTKASEYISHLCGHEGPGSLLSNLKAKDYGTSVSAGVSTSNNDNNSMFYIFAIHVKLTGNGLSNWITVVEMIYDYLKMLKTQEPQEWIFNEYKKISEVTYNFLDEQDESDFVEEIACCMAPYREIDRVNLLSCNHLYWEFDPETIKNILTQLIPSNCRIDLLSSSFSQSSGSTGVDDNESPLKKFRTEYLDGVEIKVNDGGDDSNDSGDDDSGDDDSGDDDSGDDDSGDDDSGDDDSDEDDNNKIEEVINLTTDQIKDLFKGPIEWIDLILPPCTTPLQESHFGNIFIYNFNKYFY
jgi:secreted Zn-dependent insulinase-like peptidase